MRRTRRWRELEVGLAVLGILIPVTFFALPLMNLPAAWLGIAVYVLAGSLATVGRLVPVRTFRPSWGWTSAIQGIEMAPWISYSAEARDGGGWAFVSVNGCVPFTAVPSQIAGLRLDRHPLLLTASHA